MRLTACSLYAMLSIAILLCARCRQWRPIAVRCMHESYISRVLCTHVILVYAFVQWNILHLTESLNLVSPLLPRMQDSHVGLVTWRRGSSFIARYSIRSGACRHQWYTVSISAVSIGRCWYILYLEVLVLLLHDLAYGLECECLQIHRRRNFQYRRLGHDSLLST